MDDLRTGLRSDTGLERQEAANVTNRSVFDCVSEAKESQEMVSDSVLSGLKAFLESGINQFRFNIAVMGQRGVGKSTFINTFRGLTPRDPGAAKVGVTDTTASVKGYRDPVHRNFVLWDLPGVGTPGFSRQEYLEKVNFNKYDSFLILGRSRFTEDDLWLPKELAQTGKTFYCIRVKIDHDVMLAKEDDCSNQLALGGLGADNQVFLINGMLVNAPCGYFPALQDKLIGGGQNLKTESLPLVPVCSCKEMIRLKVEAFEKRIWFVAALPVLRGSVSLPGFSELVDLGPVISEVEEYKRQLGLDDEALEQLSEKYHIPKDVLVNAVDRSNIPEIITRMMAEMATEEAVEVLPAMEQLPGASLAYETTSAVLRLVLSKLRDAAIKIAHLAIEASDDL